MFRSTKIVATLGPASSEPDVLERMLARRRRRGAPQFLARHGRRPPRARRRCARNCAARSGARRASWRTCRGRRSASASSRTGKVDARARRKRSSSTPSASSATASASASTTRSCRRTSSPGAVLLLDDGRSCSTSTTSRQRMCTRGARTAAMLSNNKGINRQGGGLTAPALTAKDMDDIRTAAQDQGGLPRRLVPQERRRHVHGARAAARRRRRRRC